MFRVTAYKELWTATIQQTNISHLRTNGGSSIWIASGFFIICFHREVQITWQGIQVYQLYDGTALFFID